MPRLASTLCVVSLALLASCSNISSFDQKWAATKPLPGGSNPAAPVAGKWEGTWQSDATDYAGHLQALIYYKAPTVVDKEQGQEYAAEFQLRLFEVPFDNYTVVLSAIQQPDGKIHFKGKKDLGYYKGGIWVFDGYVYPQRDEFYCDYQSDKDSGTFKLKRVLEDYFK
jgi:hypothetical protein